MSAISEIRVLLFRHEHNLHDSNTPFPDQHEDGYILHSWCHVSSAGQACPRRCRPHLMSLDSRRARWPLNVAWMATAADRDRTNCLRARCMRVAACSRVAARVRRICRAGDLPLLVDADHGYGNALLAPRKHAPCTRLHTPNHPINIGTQLRYSRGDLEASRRH